MTTSLITPNSDYTDRDFTALRKRMRSLIKSVYPTWTVEQIANFGNLLVELYCFVGDVLAFYQNNQAAESRITTAMQMKNMLGLVRLLNYQPRSPRAAQTDLTITLEEPVPSKRTITFTPPWKGLANPVTVSTEDTQNPTSFELQENIVIEEGETSGTGSVKNSTHIGDPDDLAGNPGETFISNEMPNQTYKLSQGPYLDASAALSDIGGTWSQAENNSLVTAGPSDHVYRVEIDENGYATLCFGNGVCGAIPSGTVRIAYEIGGGVDGNSIARNSLTKIDGQFVDNLGASVSVLSLTHEGPADGLDRESLEEIRVNAPLSIQTLSRTVTKSDYEHQAVRAGMTRALLMAQSENRALAPNTGEMYCVPLGNNVQGGKMSSGQKADVKAHYTQDPSTQYPFAKPGLIGFQTQVYTAFYIDIGIRIRIYLKKNAPDTTVASIVMALQNRFKLFNSDGTRNMRVDFGINIGALSKSGTAEVAVSDLMGIVTSVPGVREIGDGASDFQLFAWRVAEITDGYESGFYPATLVQGLARTDVPLRATDFPRLKMRAFGQSSPDIFIMDGDNADAILYP